VQKEIVVYLTFQTTISNYKKQKRKFKFSSFSLYQILLKYTEHKSCKVKYRDMTCHQNVQQNHNLIPANNSSENRSHDSSVGIVLGYRLDDQGSKVRFPADSGSFLFTTASRMAMGLTQSPIQGVPGALSLGIKQPRCEADHSPPSSAEVKQ
jgi:hypothetical protein